MNSLNIESQAEEVTLDTLVSDADSLDMSSSPTAMETTTENCGTQDNEDQSGEAKNRKAKTRKARGAGAKQKHVFNNKNMLNSQMQKASLDELKAAAITINDMISVREEEEEKARLQRQHEESEARKLMDMASEKGISKDVLLQMIEKI